MSKNKQLTRLTFDPKKGREIYKYIGPRRMPACNKEQIDQIMNVVHSFHGKNRLQAEEFANLMGHKRLCIILHAMRRWHGAGWGWNSAKKILGAKDVLFRVMDLDPPYGSYRGFKVDRDSEYSELKIGDTATIPVTRNRGCSSWTTKRDLANKFSGATKEKVGLVVKFLGGKDVETFLAPPSHSVGWFNDLYKRTMGESHRFSEHEFAICSKDIKVEIVAVKRR